MKELPEIALIREKLQIKTIFWAILKMEMWVTLYQPKLNVPHSNFKN